MARFMVLALLVLVVACQSQKESEDSNPEIIGRWIVERIYNHSTDITQSTACKFDPSCQPPDHGWLSLTQDGRYDRFYGITSRHETGHWTFKKETRYNALHLDNDDGDDSRWIVTIEGETMSCKRVKDRMFWEQPQDRGWPPETTGYEVVYVRQ